MYAYCRDKKGPHPTLSVWKGSYSYLIRMEEVTSGCEGLVLISLLLKCKLLSDSEAVSVQYAYSVVSWLFLFLLKTPA